MSFDLYFFRPKSGIAPEEAAKFFDRHAEAEDEEGEEEELDEEGEIEGPFDPDLTWEEVVGSMIGAICPSGERSPELADWLKRLDANEADFSELESIKEAEPFLMDPMTIGIKGTWAFAMSYGGGDEGMRNFGRDMAAAVPLMAKRGIYIYDPQEACVVPRDQAAAHFEKSIQDGENFHAQVMAQLMGSGEPTYDLYFFRVTPEATVDQALDYLEAGGELENEGDPIPIDKSLEAEELVRILAGPLLSEMLPPEKRSAGLDAWIQACAEGREAELDPMEVDEIQGVLGNWMAANVDGVHVRSYNHTEGLPNLAAVFAFMAQTLAPKSIFIADPQAGCVVPVQNAEAHFAMSIEAAMEAAAEEAAGQGGEDEDEEDENEDDEKK